MHADPTARRFLGFDVARGIALVLMFVAHTAPGDGPARILMVSEFLTAPLFATLMGCGIALGARHVTTGGRAGWLASQWVRAALLFLLGVALMPLYTGVYVVLMHLALVVLVVPLLVRLPWWARLASAAALATASVISTSMMEHTASGGLLQLVGSGPYFPFAFLAYGLVGTLLVDFHTSWGQLTHRRRIAVTTGVAGAALALMLALIVAPNLLGHPVHAYEGSALETAGNLAGSVGIIIACWLLDDLVPASAGTTRQLLAAPGRATLTLYVLQSGLLRLWVETTGTGDDSWLVLGGLVVVAVALAVVWQEAMRRVGPSGLWHGFRHGPVEGIEGAATHGTRQLLSPEAPAP